MDLSGIGRLLVVVGLVVALAGALFVVAGKLGLGRLPGDVSFSWGNFRVYAPLATSLVLSLVLTLVLGLFLRR